MKYCLSLLILFFALTSCQKELTEEIFNQPPVDTTIIIVDTPVVGNLRANIDSLAWVADKAVSATYSPGDSLLPALIIIKGIGKDNRSLEFGVVDSGLRVYDIYANDTSFNGATYSDSSSRSRGAFFTSDGPSGTKIGTIEITAIDSIRKTIAGRFSFKVYRKSDSAIVNFTNGEFSDIPFTRTAGLPPSTVTDTFHVKIKDTLFNAYTIIAASVAGSVSINASDSVGNKRVTISIPENIAPGTYNFNLISRNAIYSTGGTTAYVPAANSGTLVILENNAVSKRVRGNFSFNGSVPGSPSSTAALTDGYFSVELF